LTAVLGFCRAKVRSGVGARAIGKAINGRRQKADNAGTSVPIGIFAQSPALSPALPRRSHRQDSQAS
jgi:hypothetical protein